MGMAWTRFVDGLDGWTGDTRTEGLSTVRGGVMKRWQGRVESSSIRQEVTSSNTWDTAWEGSEEESSGREARWGAMGGKRGGEQWEGSGEGGMRESVEASSLGDAGRG